MAQAPSRITNEQTFSKSEVIYTRGDPAMYTYLLKEGQIELLDADKNIIKTVRTGQVFGESALISDEATRVHTAVVLENSTCLRIAREPLEEQLQREDPFISALFRILQGNLCNVMQMKKISRVDVNALAETLVEESDTNSESG